MAENDDVIKRKYNFAANSMAYIGQWYLQPLFYIACAKVFWNENEKHKSR
ncbi:MAG: hypothetical protein NTY88_10795 [Bacteroidetes bacterium]|nr:hypothetical protein [Bacteroidota bacterium]